MIDLLFLTATVFVKSLTCQLNMLQLQCVQVSVIYDDTIIQYV